MLALTGSDNFFKISVSGFNSRLGGRNMHCRASKSVANKYLGQDEKETMGGVLQKQVLLKIPKGLATTLLKRDSNTDVFQ